MHQATIFREDESEAIPIQQVMKTWAGMEGYIHAFQTLTIAGGKWPAACSGRSTPLINNESTAQFDKPWKNVEAGTPEESFQALTGIKIWPSTS
jgi:hypothetical protein